MHICSVHLRRFRGLARASLPNCAALNVLIGRNNAGKSSILVAIELALDRMQKGRAASLWHAPRPSDEFTERDVSRPFQIGLTFEVTNETLIEFQKLLLEESPGLDVAVGQLAGSTMFAVILEGEALDDSVVIYVKEFGVGDINNSSDDLTIFGTRILNISQDTAKELGNRENIIRSIQKDFKSLEDIPSHIFEIALRQKSEGPNRWRSYLGDSSISRRLTARLDEIFGRSASTQEALAEKSLTLSDFSKEIQDIEDTELLSPLTTFAGTSKRVPSYVAWLMRHLASGRVVSFKEVRKSVGREEASQLLELKLRRGGTQSLARIQETVRVLLGVEVDAFQSEQPAPRRAAFSSNAEMDIDNFLVEANGAGIREALRIILDLELGDPVLATVEEPEVHLHPGLERVIHGYLVEKSRTMQLFIATHSANFLDATTRQNVYLVSRKKGASSTVEKVASEDDLLLMSQEIGIRPSTVLLFDRIIFVEGPSDEAIFSELARRLGFDLASQNATFVQMAGSTGFSHFAADATIDLLSRRQIRMWFIIDRDERSDADIAKLSDRLGGRAKIVVLTRRELENYILDPNAISALIIDKSATTASKISSVDLVELETKISEAANALLDRAISLSVEKQLLGPLYARYGGSSVTEKLEAMGQAIRQRIEKVSELEEGVRKEISSTWQRDSTHKAPGSDILGAVFKHYGLTYNKTKDGQRLAREINVEFIDKELKGVLSDIAKPDVAF